MTVDLGLLSDLAPDERRQVVALMRRHSYAAGEVVFHEGDAADSVHFVVEGRVVARRSSEQGDRVAYAVMGPGQAFGELAMVVRDGRRTATIECVERTVTLSLPFADFERLCARQPDVSRLLVRLLAERVNRLTESLMQALHTPAELRVIRSLVLLCGLYSQGARRGSPVAVALNQTEIAELAGVTRPTANRVLRRLEDDGVVALDRGRLTVLDAAALHRASAVPAPRLVPHYGLGRGTRSDPSGGARRRP
ncbi:Crp/Fnr family transcriptional regulator [Terrabacter sp. NPDC080008]|uniref:Crp/Fnr family transcriptional regulator n=1 Tax=Terrabacter sp. NPDC080008 TaxID=3155176 RepID=UPI00344DE713